MIAIIDYGAGNLFSVQNALNFLGVENMITKDKSEIISADAIILPGVGAFTDAMNMLNESGLVDTIKTEAQKKPFLGICLGMQMIFEKGYEFGVTDGLGLISGSVKLMTPENLNIPHIGWNSLEYNVSSPLTIDLGDEPYVYFVHSFAVECSSEYVIAYTDYGMKVPALVGRNNVYGAQFHPEKSGEVGLKILRNFANLI